MSEDSQEMLPEYRREDLGKGVRGKYYKRYMKGTNVVVLEKEVARAFPDSKSVNDALKSLMRSSGKAAHPVRSSPAPKKAPVRKKASAK